MHTTVLTYGVIFAVHTVARLKRGFHAPFILGLKCTLEFQAGAESQFNTLCFWLSLQSPKNFNLPSAQLKVSTPTHWSSGVCITWPPTSKTATSCCCIFVFFLVVFSLWCRSCLKVKGGFVFWWAQVSGSELRVPKGRGTLPCYMQTVQFFFATAADCSCNSAYLKTRHGDIFWTLVFCRTLSRIAFRTCSE